MLYRNGKFFIFFTTKIHEKTRKREEEFTTELNKSLHGGARRKREKASTNYANEFEKKSVTMRVNYIWVRPCMMLARNAKKVEKSLKNEE